jgi:hypothetical protein
VIGSGLGKMGAGSAGTILVCTDWTGAGLVGAVLAGAIPWGPGAHVVSLGSGSVGTALVNVGRMGVGLTRETGTGFAALSLCLRLTKVGAAGMWAAGAPVAGVGV